MKELIWCSPSRTNNQKPPTGRQFYTSLDLELACFGLYHVLVEEIETSTSASASVLSVNQTELNKPEHTAPLIPNKPPNHTSSASHISLYFEFFYLKQLCFANWGHLSKDAARFSQNTGSWGPWRVCKAPAETELSLQKFPRTPELQGPGWCP